MAAASGSGASAPCVSIKIVSPFSQIQSGLKFDDLPGATTVYEFKQRIQESVESHPPPSSQRLIFRGRILDDKISLLSALNNNPASGSPSASYTVHLSLIEPAGQTFRSSAVANTKPPLISLSPNGLFGNTSILTPASRPATAVSPPPGQAPIFGVPPIPTPTTNPAPEVVHDVSAIPPGPSHGFQFAPPIPAHSPPPSHDRASRSSQSLDTQTLTQCSQSSRVKSWIVSDPNGVPRAVVLIPSDHNMTSIDLDAQQDGLEGVLQEPSIPSLVGIRQRLRAQRQRAAGDSVQMVEDSRRSDYLLWNLVDRQPSHVEAFGVHPSRRSQHHQAHPSNVPDSSHFNGGNGRAELTGRGREGPAIRLVDLPDISLRNRLGGHNGNAVPPANFAPGNGIVRGADAGAQPAHARLRARAPRHRVYRFNFSIRHLWTVLRVVIFWYFFSGPLFVLARNSRQLMWPGVVLGFLYLFHWCGALGDAPQLLYEWYRNIIFGAPSSRHYIHIFSAPAGTASLGRRYGIIEGAMMIGKSALLAVMILLGSLVPNVGAKMVETQEAHLRTQEEAPVV